MTDLKKINTEQNSHSLSLQSWQRRIVVTGWLTYASFYLGRVNLSTAIPELRESLSFTAQDAGLLGSGFFLLYAFGQLISGHLGDRISPRKLVLGGMLLSTAMNLIFGSVDSLSLMLVVWTANGVFQSTGWAPILKVLANWHDATQKRKVAGIYATSYVAGNALTWMLTGWLVANLSWRAAFWVPGSLMGIVAIAWYRIIRDTPHKAGLKVAASSMNKPKTKSYQKNVNPNMLIALQRFWPLCFAAVTAGMLLFALIIWIPSYLVEKLSLNIATASNISMLLPIAGTLGTLTVSWLVATRFCGKEIGLGVVVFTLVGLLLVLFPLAYTSVWLTVLLLSLIGCMSYGVATIIITTLPMVLSSSKETSTVAGLIDFAFNIGASLAGIIVGIIIDTFSWSAVFLALAICAVATSILLMVFFLWLNRFKGRWYKSEQVSC